MKQKYHKYQILIGSTDCYFGGKHLDVVATDIDAAIADVLEAYTNVRIITYTQVA